MCFLGILLYFVIIFAQPQELNLPIKGWPLEQIVMGITGVSFLCGSLLNRRIKLFNAHQNILMVWLWGVIVVSTFQVGWTAYTFNVFIEWGKFIIAYFLIINIIDSQKKLKLAVWTIVLSMSVTAVIGMLQHYGIDYTGIGTKLYNDALGRIVRIRGVGIFGMNQLAHACAFVIPLIFGLFLVTRNIFAKLFLAALFLCYYYVIYLTVSRGGMLAGFFVVALLVMSFTKSKKIKSAGLGIVIVVSILIIHVLPRLETVGSFKTESSAKGRLDVWGEALSVLKNSHFLGVGKGQFREYCSISPHNSYIQTVTELGIAGLFLWLALFYYSFKNLKLIGQAAEKSGTKFQIIFIKCFRVSLGTYLVSSYFSGSAYYSILYAMFALAVVMQYDVHAPGGPRERVRFRFKDLRTIFLFEAAAILVIHLMAL